MNWWSIRTGKLKARERYKLYILFKTLEMEMTPGLEAWMDGTRSEDEIGDDCYVICKKNYIHFSQDNTNIKSITFEKLIKYLGNESKKKLINH